MILSINRLSGVVLGMAALALVSAAACGGGGASGEPTRTEDPALTAIVTMYPLEEFTSRIGGQRVEVTNLLPAGADAHSFEASPSDLRSIAEADVLIYNGLGFESWVEGMLDSVGDDVEMVLAAAPESLGEEFEDSHEEGEEHDEEGAHTEDHEGPEVEENHDHGPLDPHVWLDPVRARVQVERIRDALTELDPDGESAFRENADQLLGDLQELHEDYASALASCRLDVFITSHDAFNYLADRYGLHADGISGINPHSSPSAAQLSHLSREMSELGVEHILVSPLESQRLSDTLAAETGATVLTLHTVQNLTPVERQAGEDYFSIMRDNLDNLAAALDC
ncbi:MAG: metal ABC transporter solute-binding protein, Zn/Mn family, partial [Chloroflexota bacterium]